MISRAEQYAVDFMKEFPEIVDKEKLTDYLCKFSVDKWKEGYDDGVLSVPADKLEEKYGQTFSVEELGAKGGAKFGGKYYLDMWFNDMVGWGHSHAVSFVPKKNDTIDELVEEFDKWAELKGKDILKKFEAVPYPDSSKSKELDFYFSENYKIVEELSESIKKYCKREMEE